MTLAGIGAANEVEACWMFAFNAAVIAAMQVGYAGGSIVLAAVD
jgi:hypothetical protein